MNWEPIFNTLKEFFGNDPTMMLLLTVAFFFLKTLWPQPQPASQQILTGYLARIRDALRLGNRDGAELLAQEAIGKATEAVSKEVEPLVRSPLTIITSLLGNNTIMPLILIGGVFLVMMLGQGGCTPKAMPPDVHTPIIQPTSMEVSHDARVPLQFLGGADRSRTADVHFVSLNSDAEPWAWTGAADGEPLDSGGDDRRGQPAAYTGAIDLVDGPGIADVAARECSAGVCSRPASGATQWRAQPATRPVGTLVRGQPVRNIARVLARPFRWLRLPGRPFARLCRRR